MGLIKAHVHQESDEQACQYDKDEVLKCLSTLINLVGYAIRGREMLAETICQKVHRQPHARDFETLDTFEGHTSAADIHAYLDDPAWEWSPYTLLFALEDQVLADRIKQFISFDKFEKELLELTKLQYDLRSLSSQVRNTAPEKLTDF